MKMHNSYACVYVQLYPLLQWIRESHEAINRKARVAFNLLLNILRIIHIFILNSMFVVMFLYFFLYFFSIPTNRWLENIRCGYRTVDWWPWNTLWPKKLALCRKSHLLTMQIHYSRRQQTKTTETAYPQKLISLLGRKFPLDLPYP